MDVAGPTNGGRVPEIRRDGLDDFFRDLLSRSFGLGIDLLREAMRGLPCRGPRTKILGGHLLGALRDRIEILVDVIRLHVVIGAALVLVAKEVLLGVRAADSSGRD